MWRSQLNVGKQSLCFGVSLAVMLGSFAGMERSAWAQTSPITPLQSRLQDSQMRDLLDRALRTSANVSNPNEKASILIDIAKQYHQLQLRQKAMRVLAKALTSAQQVEIFVERIKILTAIANTYDFLGERSLAYEVLAQAESLLPKVTNQPQSSNTDLFSEYTLRAVMLQYAQMGDEDRVFELLQTVRESEQDMLKRISFNLLLIKKIRTEDINSVLAFMEDHRFTDSSFETFPLQVQLPPESPETERIKSYNTLSRRFYNLAQLKARQTRRDANTSQQILAEMKETADQLRQVIDQVQNPVLQMHLRLSLVNLCLESQLREEAATQADLVLQALELIPISEQSSEQSDDSRTTITPSERTSYLTMLSRVLMQLGQYDHAVDLVRQIEDRNQVSFLIYLGNRLVEQGQVFKATQVLNQATVMTQSNPDVTDRANNLLQIIGIHWQANQRDRAIALLNQVIQIFNETKDSQLAGSIAYALMALGQYDQALQYVLVADDDESFATLAQHHVEQRQYDQAFTILETVRNPYTKIEIWKAIANQYIEDGESDRAFAVIRQAIQFSKENPNELDPSVIYNLFYEPGYSLAHNKSSDITVYETFITLLETLPDDDRSDLFFGFSSSLISAQRLTEFNQIMATRLETAKAIANTTERDNELLQISEQYATSKQFETAIAIAETIATPENQSRALLKIVEFSYACR
jgi:tetratricopeptide (TPR) repeat protein